MKVVKKVFPTAEEMAGFYIVRAILCAKVNVSRIVHRDQQSYFGVLLDNNNRKPICRLNYNGKKKYVTFFDNGKEEKMEIDNNSQLYDHASGFVNVVDLYEKKRVGALVEG